MSVTCLDHFDLRQAPFGITPDPALFYNSQGHQRALDWIEAGIAARAPILSLTGAAGTGKTTLLRLLPDRHGGEWTIGLVSGFHSRRDNILAQARRAFGLPDQGDSPALLSSQIRRFAGAIRANGGFTVLMVDEAEALDAERISALASLVADSAEDGALTLLLAGRPELRSLLATPKLRGLRIAESAHAVLSPLSDDDTAGYVEHRLARSGARAPIFSLRAIQMLHSLGMGMPRFINVLADYCLTIAAEEGVSRLDRAWVSAVLHEASATGVLSRLAKLAREGPPQSAAPASPGPGVPDAPRHATAADTGRHATPLILPLPDTALAPATAQGAPSPAEPHEEPKAGQAAPMDRERRDPPLRGAGAPRAVPSSDAALPAPSAPAPALHLPAASALRSPLREPRRRTGLWLSSAVVVLACAAAFAWWRPGQAPAPVATDTAPPSASAAVQQTTATPAQPAVSPPLPQSPAPVPEPVAITPEPTVTALMQRALQIETQDPAAAAVAYARAAIRGRARAAYYLGQLHETGTGVEPSPGMARLWYAAAADLPAAQRRLQGLSAAGASPGTPAAPVPIFQARLNTGASEMIWSVPGAGTPIRFRVELFGPSEEPLPVQETTVPGLIVPFPVSMWRVIAVGPDSTESAPSAMVRMIPAEQ